MADSADTLHALTGARDPAARRRHCAALVTRARLQVRAGFEQGSAPAALVKDLAASFDQVIGALFLAAEIPVATMVGLVALGGYGRGELFPHSDLDLLILYQGEDEELTTRLVEQIVYPLWDAGVSVGHSVRDIDQTLEQAAGDLTVRTSLLDMRLLAGDEGPFYALQAGATREYFGPQRVHAFVEALRQERATRHRRFGETEYLLEPNIKNSKGGLRDLNTGLWAAKARFGVSELGGLLDHDAATPRQVKALEEALDFMRELRLRMHLRADRAQDHLQFELQEALAPTMFPAVNVPGVMRRSPAIAPAVERLMHAFYRHARAVVMETDGILERCGQAERPVPAPGIPISAAPDEHLQLVDRRIHSSSPQRFWDEPAEMLRAYQVALAHASPLDQGTRDAIAEAAADEPGAQLVADEAAARRWLELLCDPEGAFEVTVLEEIHHAGLVSALVPEFERCTGRIQHDLYHVYTVDMHTLYVVALLKTWRRGELQEQYPTPVEVLARVERLETLMLAALLHDVAKPLGSGHAQRGARLALGVSARLGLDARAQQEVSLLVAQHLTMAHLSQRRDLSDPEVIAGFGRVVGSVDRLRKLYLLTVADTAMTSPGNLSPWKAALLDELFVKTFAHLSHDPGWIDQSPAQLRDALELVLRRRWGERGAQLAGMVPDPMLLSFEVQEVARHLGVVRTLEQDADALVRFEARLMTEPSETMLTICCRDAPGLLATLTGVMLAHRLEILAAQVYTLELPEPESAASGSGRRARQTELPLPGPAAPAPLVLDIFMVKTPARTRWDALAADLERALRGDLDVSETVRRTTRPSSLPSKVLPRVPIEVTVDNAASGRLTVIDVQAPDRLGILHAITRTLSEEGLVIHLSKVATEAGRVIDNFYVSEGTSGGKVTGEERLAAIRARITAAIEALLPDKARFR